jgi:hypothetical protein
VALRKTASELFVLLRISTPKLVAAKAASCAGSDSLVEHDDGKMFSIRSFVRLWMMQSDPMIVICEPEIQLTENTFPDCHRTLPLASTFTVPWRATESPAVNA